jgi:cytochrome P450
VTPPESTPGARLEFGTAEYDHCPYDFYTRARESGPAYKIDEAGMVMIGRYADVMAVCKAAHSFSSHRREFGAGDNELEAIMRKGWPQAAALVTADPPEHSRYRRLVNRPFTTGAVAVHEPVIRQTVTSLIDSFIADGEVELMSQFAIKLPVSIIGQIMGVPEADHDRFILWADLIAESVSGYLPRERALTCAHGLVEMQHYFAGLLEQRRAEPGNDLVSALVTAGDVHDRPLDLTEILEIIRIFVAGGTESTASLIGSAFYLLLTHRDQLEEVLADHALVPQMLEETLRLESPVQWNPRLVERDHVELDGVAMPAGTRLMLNWGSANRDPTRFGTDADFFNIHRAPVSHAAFGHAYHFCLGAPLARLEARIACEQLLERLADLELAVPADKLRFVGHGVVRRLERLPLRFQATTSPT